MADGDKVTVDVAKRRIDLDVPASELATRRANLKLPEPRYRHGVLAKYARLVTGADKGAVTEP